MMVKHKLENIQRWESQIESWRSSGVSRREYCNQKKIQLSTFHGWCHKIKNCKSYNTDESSESFVKMIFGESPANPKANPSKEIGIKLSIDNRIRIDLEVGFDKNSLLYILDLLNCIKC
jgi:hypothetical protein